MHKNTVTIAAECGFAISVIILLETQAMVETQAIFASLRLAP